MGRFISAIGHEILRLLPAVLFFYAAFNLVILTENLAVEEYGLKVYHLAGAAVGALLIGKMLVVVDAVPLTHAFRRRPLIYVVLWRTAIYLLAAVVFLYIERLIGPLWRLQSLVAAHRKVVAGIIWPRFWAVQIWLAVLFFLFAASQELAHAIGSRQLRQMFLGR